jgi:hypothetical protein
LPNDACTHQTRQRLNDLGWFSRETACLSCGQFFDPDQEEQLRSRDVLAGTAGFPVAAVDPRRVTAGDGARSGAWPAGRELNWHN